MGGGIAAERIGGELLMTDYLTTDTELTSVANAIRTKGGTSAQLVYPTGFVSAINAIPTGGGTLPTCTMTIMYDGNFYVECSNFSNGVPSGSYLAVAVGGFLSPTQLLIFSATDGVTSLSDPDGSTAFFSNDPTSFGAFGICLGNNAFAYCADDAGYGATGSEDPDGFAGIAYNVIGVGTYTATVIEF